jgi:DNA-binding XRE family transcriptional regulator
MAEHARVVPLRRQPTAESSSREPPHPETPHPETLHPETPHPETPHPETPHPQPLRPEPLWREVLGHRLRALRLDQRETLAETAGRAGISPQYLSEIERGRKEPSSEMIAALAGALGTTLIRLTEQVAGELRRDLRRQQAARAPRRSGPVMLSLAA